MDCPSALKGALYPSTRKSRCPLFHPCQATRKCQSYDPNSVMCEYCEHVIRPNPSVGGYLAEGEFVPDLQHSLKIIQQIAKRPWLHPDNPSQRINSKEVVNKYEETVAASNRLAEFAGISNLTMEHEIVERIVGRRGPDGVEVLGRIE